MLNVGGMDVMWGFMKEGLNSESPSKWYRKTVLGCYCWGHLNFRYQWTPTIDAPNHLDWHFIFWARMRLGLGILTWPAIYHFISSLHIPALLLPTHSSSWPHFGSHVATYKVDRLVAATKVCFSGSILTQTFDIQVISYDGTLQRSLPWWKQLMPLWVG